MLRCLDTGFLESFLLKVYLKYSATRRIFNFVLKFWKCGQKQKLHIVEGSWIIGQWIVSFMYDSNASPSRKEQRSFIHFYTR